ncbi:hypothetical protein AVEN_222602-1, partial [Araneus ventricosus]
FVAAYRVHIQTEELTANLSFEGHRRHHLRYLTITQNYEVHLNIVLEDFSVDN